MAMKTLTAIVFLIGMAVTFFLGSLYLERKALPYENGRYFDAGQSVVFLEQSVNVYLFLFLSSLILTLFLLVKTVKVFQSGSDGNV